MADIDWPTWGFILLLGALVLIVAGEIPNNLAQIFSVGFILKYLFAITGIFTIFAAIMAAHFALYKITTILSELSGFEWLESLVSDPFQRQ